MKNRSTLFSALLRLVPLKLQRVFEHSRMRKSYRVLRRFRKLYAVGQTWYSYLVEIGAFPLCSNCVKSFVSSLSEIQLDGFLSIPTFENRGISGFQTSTLYRWGFPGALALFIGLALRAIIAETEMAKFVALAIL